MTWHMRIAYWITKATNIHNMQYVLLFYCINGCKKAPHCYVLRISPLLLLILKFTVRPTGETAVSECTDIQYYV